MTREIGLHTRMDAHLKLPAHELLYFQDYLKNGASSDETKMARVGEVLCEKVESSREFFAKVLNENEFYFKSVHPTLYRYGTVEFTETQIIGKFLLFWYVIRPYNAIASCEHKFTYHSIQHAFFEYASFLESIRVPILIQHWSHYYTLLNQQQLQLSFNQLKVTYDQLKLSMETILASHESKFDLQKKDYESRLEIQQKQFDSEFESQKKEFESTRINFENKIIQVEEHKNQLEVQLSATRNQLEQKQKENNGFEKEVKDLRKKCDFLDSKAQKYKTFKSEVSALTQKMVQKQQSFADLESKSLDLQAKLDESQKLKKDKTCHEIKTLRQELVKSKKMISDLENLLLTPNSTAKSTENANVLPERVKLEKDIVDNNIEEARVLVDLFATSMNSEKIVHVLQNYVVSSMKDRPDEEFPAWLVVAQSLLRSICSDVGLAKGFLSGRFLSSTYGLERREDVFMGLLCWKVESRYRALCWLRNRVVRGFSTSGAMGDITLGSFYKYVSDQQKIAGKVTLTSNKTSPELTLELSTLEVLRRETSILIDNETFYPVSGSVFIPTVPSTLASALFAAVKNFALLNVCCFVSLMESDGDKSKKLLLDIIFELYENSSSTTLNLSENKFISPVLLTCAHEKITNTFSMLSSFPRFKVLLKQISACADSFQDLYSKAFLFFEDHQDDYFRQKRMLTLHTHVESLLDSFWATQEVSRHSEKIREDLPDSMTGKIMAMEVLWNEESDSLVSSKKNLDALLLSLNVYEFGTKKVKTETCTVQTNTFLQSLSHLLIEGKLVISDLESTSCSFSAKEKQLEQQTKNKLHSLTEEILGYICNEMKGNDLREFLAAIQESIYSFKEVRKGKQVMVEGKSSLGKILQSLVVGEDAKK